MSKIPVFPQPGGRRQGDDANAVRLAASLRSALDGVGKTLAALLITLLADIEESSTRLSLVIERTAAASEKVSLRAEQQGLRATIAQLKKAIDNGARVFARS